MISTLDGVTLQTESDAVILLATSGQISAQHRFFQYDKKRSGGKKMPFNENIQNSIVNLVESFEELQKGVKND